MNTIELFTAILGSSAVTALLTYLLNYKKNSLESKETEVDIDEKLINRYKIQLAELLIEVQSLRGEVATLKQLLADSMNEDCIKKDCPKRQTKKQLA